MRRIRFATLLTLAALSAAPLLHADTWTPTGWDGTLDLSGGSATVSVLIHTDANFEAQRSPIFEVNDRLHTDGGNTAFRMADADNANANGNDIGIVRDNAGTTWANGSKTFPTEPGETYLLSLVYVYDGERLTVTAYVNGTLIYIYTGFSTRSEQENLTAQTFQTWPDIPFYTIVSANGYAQALTAGQLAAMAGKGTSDLAAVTPLDVLQADLAALPAAGGTVTLAGDVDASGVGEPIVLDKPVTLVGGGHTLTAPTARPPSPKARRARPSPSPARPPSPAASASMRARPSRLRARVPSPSPARRAAPPSAAPPPPPPAAPSPSP